MGITTARKDPGFQFGRPGRCWPWLQYIRESSFMYSFCCSGARRQVIEMNSISHFDCPEIGIRIVAMGFGLFIYYLWLSLSILWPQALDSAFLPAVLIYYFPVFFSPLLPGSSFSIDIFRWLEVRARLGDPKCSKEWQQYRKTLSPSSGIFNTRDHDSRRRCLQQAFLHTWVQPHGEEQSRFLWRL